MERPVKVRNTLCRGCNGFIPERYGTVVRCKFGRDTSAPTCLLFSVPLELERYIIKENKP